VTSIARPLADADFEAFDLILAMDRDHLTQLRARCPAPLRSRIRLMREYERPRRGSLDVPDPYYDDEAAFERVFDLLENCCRSLLDELRG
jgi:protein-tyrosine phosphatase